MCRHCRSGGVATARETKIQQDIAAAAERRVDVYRLLENAWGKERDLLVAERDALDIKLARLYEDLRGQRFMQEAGLGDDLPRTRLRTRSGYHRVKTLARTL